MDQIGWILNWVITISGPVLIVYSIVAFIRTQRFLRICVETQGEVTRLERSKDRDRYGYTYAPVFTFTAADGKEYTVTSKVESSPPGFDTGESVRVRYDPANPEDARIHTFFQTWGAAVIFGTAGAIFIGVGLARLGVFHIPWTDHNWSNR